MRAKSTQASVGRPAALARRLAVAVLLATLALLGRGVAATPRIHADPAKIWVINGNVAAATATVPVEPYAFASALEGGAATRAPYVSQFDAFDTATGGQVSSMPQYGGSAYVVVQTDGSMTSVTLNGRGLECSPTCDGVAWSTPDPVDHVIVFEVIGPGTRSPGDSFPLTVVQDAVALSKTITVVSQFYDVTVVAAKSAIQAGAESCNPGDSPAALTRSAATATFTDINGTPLVGYSVFWGSTAPSTMVVAWYGSTSRVLADGTTIAATTMVCGVSAGAADLTMSYHLSGPVWVTRSRSIPVRGVPASIALIASPSFVPCDGSASSTITSTVLDAGGYPVVDGTPVNFSVAAFGTADPINDSTIGGQASSVITPLTGATSGVTVVATAGYAQSSIDISCATPAPDSSAHPTPILMLPYTGYLDTAGFTTEPGETLPCGSMGATAWYELNLPLGGADLTVDTAGSDFDTALAAYVMPPMSPPGSLSLLGCNASGTSSSVRFIASAPGTYRIQAGGQGGAAGNLVLNVHCTNDLDCDGLTDADEAALGSDPNVPDTDGDGLGDGLEVHTFHTSPILVDTDGDACGDGKELQLKPPTDPANEWDYYSVPVPALFAAPDPLVVVKDGAVSASDAQAVFSYFKIAAKTGTTEYEQDLDGDGVKDGREYDRSVVGSGVSGPPDGIISASDAQLAFAQFKLGYHC